MSLDLRMVGRLLAWQRGRAVLTASHRRVAILPEARVLCPLQLAGEDATLHAVAWGPLDGDPVVEVVPDPRARADQHRLFAWLGAELDGWMQDLVAREAAPQLWLPSGAALDLLDLLAERLRSPVPDAPGARLSRALGLLLRQSHLEGSQVVVVATEALSAHWATGQQPGEDAHLGALLAWLDAPGGDRDAVAAAVAAAERAPMGCKTAPEFDHDVLSPLVVAWNKAKKAEDDVACQQHADQIAAALTGVVTPIFRATARAAAALRAARFDELPALPELVGRDLGMLRAVLFPEAPDPDAKPKPRAADHHVVTAAKALVGAEDAIEQQEAALVHGDGVARAAARLRGDAIAGAVADREDRKVGKRKVEHRLEVVTTQPLARVRAGDTVSLSGAAKVALEVLDVRRSGGETRLWLKVTGGQRSGMIPDAGDRVELLPPPPNFGRVGSALKAINQRVVEVPWTHGDALPAQEPSRAPPDDPLADVEGLR